MNTTTTLAALGGLCLWGCAHAPAPTQQLADAMAAVRAAEEAGAAEVPDAALHVKLAQEQIKQSQQLMAKDDNTEAEDKVRRARNDAELALSLAHAQTAKSKLDQFTQSSSGGEQQPMPQGETR
jgi:pyridoxal biosynthesis lyase PdxS